MKQNKFLSVLLTAALVFSLCTCAQATDSETAILLSDEGITVNGQPVSEDPGDAVYTGAEIVYYRDGTDETYGEGTDSEKHAPQEAAAHTVVTITQPGAYRLSGTLSRGQIAVDLGEEAEEDPGAVVTLILDGADVTCAVAPALIFYNVYECGVVDTETASGTVDTAAAGANVILAAGSENTFTGSHVARVYKEGTTKKLHKYDGAFYSKQSMNIYGEGGDDSGVLSIVSDNEGLGSELHLTIHGGTINISSQDDGINTNEDYVSVTTVNGGNLTINAGQGAEGDGIDSNGYLTINGGTVWTMSNPQTPDGGIDADGAITIGGGTLSAFGTRNDAVSQDSAHPYMELSFASTIPAGSVVKLTDAEGGVVWSAETQKNCQSITLTAPGLALDTPYQLYVDDVLQCWSGNQAGGFGPGGPMGGMEPPEGFEPGQMPEPPEGFDPSQVPEPPEGFDPGQRPERPEGFDPGQRPEGGFDPGGMGEGQQPDGSGSTAFTLTQAVKTFSGICDSDASGKTRVTFTVEGLERVGRDTVIEAITAITPSVEIDPSLVQVTVADDPSEDYSESCLLSDGLEAVNALLPEEDGKYTLTVGVRSGTEGYTGATQISFVPDGPVSRAQAAALLGEAARGEPAETTPFTDVPPDSQYAGYIGWAYESGIVEGIGGGLFAPDRNVTGEEMGLMIDRYLAAIGSDLTVENPYTGDLTRSQLAMLLAQLL